MHSSNTGTDFVEFTDDDLRVTVTDYAIVDTLEDIFYKKY